MKSAEDLILAYLNDDASTAEVERLFHWVREESKNAEEFARASSLHGYLREQILGERQARESGELAVVRQTSKSAKSLRTWKSAVLALAGCVVVAVGVVSLSLRNGGEPIVIQPIDEEPFVTITQTVDAVWSNDATRTKGNRLGPQTLQLQGGIVHLLFDDGVEVTLQGPAHYELIAAGMTKLTRGLLTATVPPGAEGFRVETPMVEVVDLGTVFGIELDDRGVANVSVFDGEVEVTPASNGEKQLVKEGEAIRVAKDSDIESVPFDGSSYEKVWPVSSGIERSSGSVRFTPPWPRRLRFVRSDDEIFVAPEGYATTLDEPLAVNIAEPGEYVREENLTPSEIPTSQAVRSFILHFHPVHDEDRPQFRRTTGRITFDRPVLGLIVLHEELAASADRFAGRRAGESFEQRQLELTGNRVGDVITLSDDCRTVGIDLAAPRRFSDLVRVIVDASVRPELGN